MLFSALVLNSRSHPLSPSVLEMAAQDGSLAGLQSEAVLSILHDRFIHGKTRICMIIIPILEK